MNWLEEVGGWFDAKAPLWLVVPLAILQLSSYIETILRWSRRVWRSAVVFIETTATTFLSWLGYTKATTLTQEEYDDLKREGKIDPDTLYVIVKDDDDE